MTIQHQSGFTLVELMVGSLLILVTITALMMGISNVRYTMRSIEIREKAYEKLTAYTNHWKAYVYKGEFTSNDQWIQNQWSNLSVDTLAYAIPKSSGIETPHILSSLKRRAFKVVDPDYHNYPFIYYTMTTHIQWNDIKGNTQELSYKINQLVKEEQE